MIDKHIVSIVGNDITIDSRVKKSAAVAAASGHRSSIICYTPERTRFEVTMGAVRVVKVPVPFTVRNAPGRTPVPIRPFVASELAQRRLAKRTKQLALKRRRLARSSTGPDARTQLLRVEMKLRQELYRLRSRAHVAWDRTKRRALRSRVRLRNRIFRRANNPADAVYDYEIAFGPVIEELQPDLIHAHDFHMIGVAVTAAKILRKKGIDTKVVFDAHELLEGLDYAPRLLRDWLREEEANIGEVDEVICVSPQQAKSLQRRYDLDRPPTVILNAPIVDARAQPDVTIRDDLEIEDTILVYHGTANRQRGVFLMIEALEHLPPDFHAAFVLSKNHPLIPELTTKAENLGVADRVHFVPFVESAHVPRYLSTADIAVIPLLPTGNHHKTLPNKLFEALQAGLPVLTSDMEATSAFVHRHDVGLSFPHGSAQDLAATAQRLVDNLDEFRANIDGAVRHISSWDSQASKLASVYGRLLAVVAPESIHVSAAEVTEGPLKPDERSDQTRLAIGPRNMAGQAYLMAAAVQATLGIPAWSFALEREGTLRYPIHQRIPRATWRDSSWQLRQRADLASGFTHVLTESGTGPLGSLNGGFIDEQLPVLVEDGLSVGLILHGSEIRDPRRHVHRQYSPYTVKDDLTHRLEQATARLRRHLEGLEIPTFVTTPDLLEDVDGTWLPVVVDFPRWAGVAEPFVNPVPTILHLPSRSRLKGSEYVDPLLRRLEAEGKIRYLRPETHVPPEDVIGLVEHADIVVDGIVIGAYGVMSCQSLAAGRISIANLSELGLLGQECPIVDANPGTLDGVVHELLADRDRWKELSTAGRDYAAKYHNGAYTADVLKPFLGLE